MDGGGIQSPYRHLGDESGSFSLNAFGYRTMGESVVLMSIATTGVVYIKIQEALFLK